MNNKNRKTELSTFFIAKCISLVICEKQNTKEMTKRVKKEVVYVRGVPDNNNKKSEEKTPSRSTEIAAFVFCVVGIYASYMVFGIIQEQM